MTGLPLTRSQRHAFMRMQMACHTLADPDSTGREQASARVSLYRGYRALAESFGGDRALKASAQFMRAWIENSE